MKVVFSYSQLEAELSVLRDRVMAFEEALQESDYHYARVCNELRNRDKIEASLKEHIDSLLKQLEERNA
jgi:hypothetical protein